MITPKAMHEALDANDVGLLVGVPDSLLASFCAWVEDHSELGRHLITANEGNALAVAAGHYLATGKLSAVYLQNSGLGNLANPLASLTSAEVYQIPALLIIGWRGEPGVADEPQHVTQGRVTRAQLDTLDVPTFVVDADADIDALVAAAAQTARTRSAPVALLVRKGAFAPYKSRRVNDDGPTLEREAALNVILDLARPDDVIIATTGKTSRELFELRRARGEPNRDFLTVGCMGHTSSIALGVALGQPNRRVICLDGDGSALMHLGALPIIGSVRPRNLVHVLLNNAAHESVGGQPTVAGAVDFAALSASCGYPQYLRADDAAGVADAWRALTDGPSLLELRLRVGSRADLGRPTSTPSDNKAAFMEHLRT